MNKVILCGNLGHDPETKTFPNGGSVTILRIATSEHWVDKQTGEKKEQTEWHRIEVYNTMGTNCQQHLKKGNKVLIEGSIRTKKWVDTHKIEHYSTYIKADNITFL